MCRWEHVCCPSILLFDKRALASLQNPLGQARVMPTVTNRLGCVLFFLKCNSVFTPDEPSPLDLDSLVPDLSSYVTAATEESNFAVILRMLESDANMAQSDVNLGQNMMDPHWSP